MLSRLVADGTSAVQSSRHVDGTGVCPVRLFASCHLRQCTAIDIKPVIHRWGACALGTTRVARGS